MTTKVETILNYLETNDEALFSIDYENISGSDYDSIASILPQLIEAYFSHDIAEYDESIGDFVEDKYSYEDKKAALVQYLKNTIERIEADTFKTN